MRTRGERAVLEDRRQGRPVDVLHREKVDAINDPKLIDGHNMRVAELHQCVRLVDKHGDEMRVLGQLGAHLLDDQWLFESAEPSQASPKNPCHAAFGDQLV